MIDRWLDEVVISKVKDYKIVRVGLFSIFVVGAILMLYIFYSYFSRFF